VKGPPKVALLIETALGYGRGLLRGIVRYGRLHGPWAFYITPGDLKQVLPKMEQWGGTGIIARIETPQVAKAILATGLPVIALDLSHRQLASGGPLAGVSEICPDSHKAGRMAAEHLLERGFKRFAMVGSPGNPPWSIRREEGFTARLAEDSLSCEIYPLPRPKDREWGREQALMAAWLGRLPKPIGLMACDDDRGRQVLEACRAAAARVPEDVAVVGVDNDELLCELCDPPLSSVALDTEHAGYQAAALLDGLMSGRTRSPQRILVEPLYVVTRRSTDVLALEDREVAAAVRFILDHAGQPLGVKEVVRHLTLSRRALELRFRRAVGRSIHAEIEHVRLERARRLLLETNITVAQVAEASGFAAASYFSRAFHKKYGISPTEYRARSRIPEPKRACPPLGRMP